MNFIECNYLRLENESPYWNDDKTIADDKEKLEIVNRFQEKAYKKHFVPPKYASFVLRRTIGKVNAVLIKRTSRKHLSYICC